jgi:bifunctional DNA-binding transcriptional regulator/antitoxin component of YhaV-PrlF toxin-antitoxin module
MPTYTITKKHQVTIPPVVMQALGVKAGSKVSYVIEDGQVKLIDPLKAINEVRGSVQLPERFQGQDIQGVIKQAKDEYFKNSLN